MWHTLSVIVKGPARLQIKHISGSMLDDRRGPEVSFSRERRVVRATLVAGSGSSESVSSMLS